jgi:3-phenylpropionate/trans-cinnamate dioxygenase ferredoxin subunit
MAWTKVTEAAETPAEGAIKRYRVGGRWIALARVEGRVYAFDDTCPHMEESLSEGEIDAYVVYCPMHQSGFDVRDGRVMNPPAETPLTVYPVREEAGAVWVEVP